MEQNETGCQAPERPILCINNCGFFGSSATMNMCSKCHKDMILKQEQAELALPAMDDLANVGSSSSSRHKDHIVSGNLDVDAVSVEAKLCLGQSSDDSGAAGIVAKAKAGGPNRCNACGKRVGLTGFSCRCGNVFCPAHRYSDKHDCQFDYRQAAQDAIAKANPVVKAEKLEKI